MPAKAGIHDFFVRRKQGVAFLKKSSAKDFYPGVPGV
jgi:hypothetical protein